MGVKDGWETRRTGKKGSNGAKGRKMSDERRRENKSKDRRVRKASR